jgi:hypothetical protein
MYVIMVTVPEKARERSRKEKVALEAAWYIMSGLQWLKCNYGQMWVLHMVLCMNSGFEVQYCYRLSQECAFIDCHTV